MFAKRKKAPFIESTQLSSLIAEDVEITGDVRFSHGIRIDGRIKGHVIGRAGTGPGRALLVLSDKGRIDGNVSCGNAVINGTVVGELHVEHVLELKSSAQVTGLIRYEHLQMDVGASVCGQLQKAQPVAGVNVPNAVSVLTSDTPGDKLVELVADMAARS